MQYPMCEAVSLGPNIVDPIRMQYEDFLLHSLQYISGSLAPEILKRDYLGLADHTIWVWAKETGVSSLVAHALIKALNGDVREHWYRYYSETGDRIKEYIEELNVVCMKLDEAGVPTIVLENGAIAVTYHHSLGDFDFHDFDLLLHPHNWQLARDVLHQLGYNNVNKQSTGTPSSQPREEYIKQMKIGDLRLNLQSTLIAHQWFESKEPMIDMLFQHSHYFEGASVRVLNTELFLYQLCLHSASHNYVRRPGIRLHLDIHWFLTAEDVNWANFVKLVHSYKAGTQAYFALCIPRSLFSTPIPDEVLALLRPTVWKEQLIRRLLQQAGLFNPHHKKFSRIEHILFTALLYDDKRELLHSIFPDQAWMQNRYGFRHKWFLFYYYGRRLFELATRRLFR